MTGTISFCILLIFVANCTCLRVLTSRLKEYQYLNDLGLDVRKTSALTFQIVACSDVHFGFFDRSSGPYSYKYELVIGGWGNTLTRVRRGRDAEYVQEVENSPLNCCKFQNFWISWSNPLSAGYGFVVGVDPFITVETDLGSVTQVAISTGYEHLGVWVFNFDEKRLSESDYDVDGYNQCTTNNVTYNLPVYPSSSESVYSTSSHLSVYPTSSAGHVHPPSSARPVHPTSSARPVHPTSSDRPVYPTSSEPVYSSAHASNVPGVKCVVVTTCNIWATHKYSSSSDVMTSMTSSEESLMTSMETSSLIVFETSSSIELSSQGSDRTSQTPSLEISPSPTQTSFTSSSQVTIPETTPTDPIDPIDPFWCDCDWPINGKINLSVEQKIARYRHSLTLIKSNLSAVRRRLTSAFDVRPSSRYMGASGATILGLVIGLIVMADVQRILECFMDRKRRVCHSDIIRKEEKCKTSSC